MVPSSTGKIYSEGSEISENCLMSKIGSCFWSESYEDLGVIIKKYINPVWSGGGGGVGEGRGRLLGLQ